MYRPANRIVLLFLALLAVAGSAVVYMVEPSEAAWLPKCPFHLLTGLECPSCGSTRALHFILHGDIAQGLAFNPMAPVLWLLAAAIVVLAVGFPRQRVSAMMRVLVGAYIVVYILWWIVRNL